MFFQQHKNILFDLLFSKTKQISIGITYKPLSLTRFCQQTITELRLSLNDKLFVAKVFNMNLLFKGKYILAKPNKNLVKSTKKTLPNIRKHTEIFCHLYL